MLLARSFVSTWSKSHSSLSKLSKYLAYASASYLVGPLIERFVIKTWVSANLKMNTQYQYQCKELESNFLVNT